MGQRIFRIIETNGITLRVVVEGQGPLLRLLHGFSQCWYLWRHQIGELVATGYQVASPDQRGYGGSDNRRTSKPTTLGNSSPMLSGSLTRWAGKSSRWSLTTVADAARLHHDPHSAGSGIGQGAIDQSQSCAR